MTNAARPFRFEVSARTDIGLVRAGGPNQDAFEVRANRWAPGDLLMTVADGMGGPPAGDLASQQAVAAILKADPGDTPEASVTAAYAEANRAVRSIEAGDGAPAGHPDSTGRPGTTLVVAYLLEGRALVANVGDSRLYRLRGGALEQLTHDHSLVQEEVDAGRLTEAEARVDPRNSLITRTIGGQPTVEVDQTTWPLAAGDRFLACTDGLTIVLEDPAIERLLARAATPQAAADSLVEAALRGGGPDNVTAVVVDVIAPG